MKKLFLVMASVIALNVANAQSGHNQLGIAFDLGIPTGDFGDAFGVGIGGQVKALFGIGTAGQVTLTSGYMSFKAKDLPDDIDVKASIIPILLGYRHNFSGFYVEPQVGYGIYGSKVEGLGDPYDGDESEGAFTWAAGIGYAIKGFDIGARYQSASKDGSTTSVIGFRVGYNFTLGGASASK